MKTRLQIAVMEAMGDGAFENRPFSIEETEYGDPVLGGWVITAHEYYMVVGDAIAVPRIDIVPIPRGP